MSRADPSEIDLICYPDPRLRKKSRPVEQFDAWLERLAGRMFEIMARERGIGLAAPQVGLNIRMFVCNPTGEREDRKVYVNPVLTDLVGAQEREEGCLSVPGVMGLLVRGQECCLEAFDLACNRFEERSTDLLARVWQHEIDHLEGTLVVDKLGPAGKIANRRVIRELEASYRPKGK